MSSKIESVSGRKTAQEHVKTLGYRFVARLGEGTFSKVYLTEYTSRDAVGVEKLACKLIDTAVCSAKFRRKFLPRELAVLLRVRHPHIIRIQAIVKCHSKIFIFMRYAELGDLLTFILAHGAIGESQSRIWGRQVGLALQYLHESGIAHRDLKCENILITTNFNVKLSDFGFARHVMRSHEVELSSTYCGSFDYASPEILKGTPYNPKASDMWAYGVLLYVMLNKSMPFKGRTKAVYELQLARKWQFRSRVRSKLSHQVKSLVTNLLEPNPIIRYTIDETLINDWFMDVPKLRALNPDEFVCLAEARSVTRACSSDVLHVQSKLRQSGSDVITTIKQVEQRDAPQFKSNLSLKTSTILLLQDDSTVNDAPPDDEERPEPADEPDDPQQQPSPDDTRSL
ncbi:testis-specific serine/threonine-protein kinase 6 [Culex quinquefasciatus]|uniref:Testis-specific serine/threonine-protein kinase 6 n=1 Tax=Culex quinquefasciatus TaxID=7176 RepID=B0WKC2_CULQU|nr:testis-specific serine/threonine-protein kinase 6 [Culex quinquefasciatus]|eukprot:XP_001849156.1 testis-specific serine/threonine-protein kinase 6 [Culex quinquefasciatus]